MGEFAVFNSALMDTTTISNLFIDEYMRDANEAQLKIYLYLVRMMSAGRTTSIEDMAERFNHTEKEVVRSLHFWEQKGLLRLRMDVRGNILGIQLCDIDRIPARKNGDDCQVISISAFSQSQSVLTSESAYVPSDAVSASMDQKAVSTVAAQSVSDAVPAVQENTDHAENPGLIFVVEQYIGKPLSVNELHTLYYICDELHFSEDLVDYLVQYCVGLGKKDFRYIEKVALNWAEEGISTADQAQKKVCEHTTKKAASKTTKKTNAFNQFQQNHYDFEALEKQLLQKE